jgi:hypothetical protein
MARVTQRVGPERLVAVLAEHARAAIAFDRDGAVDALPVVLRRRGDELWVGVAREVAPPEASFARAVLVVDDGSWWFELRAVTWRGHLEASVEAPPAEGEDLVWLSFVPRGAVAWDYGALHEEPTP